MFQVTEIKVPPDVDFDSNFKFITLPRSNVTQNDDTPSSSQSSPRKYLWHSPKVRGTALHRKRKEELPKYAFEDVLTVTAQDRFSKNLLLIYWALKDFSEGQKVIAREVPIYGRIGNVILSGYIDEMRFTKDRNKIIVSELKSGDDYEDSPAKTKNENRLQVVLYYYLLKTLHKIDIQPVCTTLSIDGEKTIIEDLLSYCPDGVTTPKELLKAIKLLPKLSYGFLVVEYVQAFYTEQYELSENPKDKEVVLFDEDLLKRIVEEHVKAKASPSQSVVRNLTLEL